MTHIKNWPDDLNYPHLKDMFQNRFIEWEFWGHVYSCHGCRDKFVDKIEDTWELKKNSFWEEVKKYLKQLHPDIRDFRQKIVEQASLDLVSAPSTFQQDEFENKYRDIEYHLLVCSMCSRRYETIYERLKDHDDRVRTAHEKWAAEHT